jgi:hypothetical protein
MLFFNIGLRLYIKFDLILFIVDLSGKSKPNFVRKRLFITTW